MTKDEILTQLKELSATEGTVVGRDLYRARDEYDKLQEALRLTAIEQDVLYGDYAKWYTDAGLQAPEPGYGPPFIHPIRGNLPREKATQAEVAFGLGMHDMARRGRLTSPTYILAARELELRQRISALQRNLPVQTQARRFVFNISQGLFHGLWMLVALKSLLWAQKTSQFFRKAFRRMRRHYGLTKAAQPKTTDELVFEIESMGLESRDFTRDGKVTEAIVGAVLAEEAKQ